MADIVVCCDGTWNTPTDMDNGLPAPTNVFKIYSALAPTDAEGVAIKRYYHPGVGTDGGWWDRVAGGGMGVGLAKNVHSAYSWLAGNYRPNDRIWLYGFSRGAFTVRSLSGMISRCGLLDVSGMREDAAWKAVEDVFAAYRAKSNDVKATTKLTFHNAANGAATKGTTPIHFIGVWDTVGAMGIPDDMALLNLVDEPKRYEFHDTDLSAVVKHARHAIAIDERRQSFTPTLWTDTPPKQNLVQKWFPGVHSDVGGGYGRCGLSDGALKWMMEQAQGQGLAFRPKAWDQIQPNAQDVLHDSLTGVFKSLKTRPRQVPRFDAAQPDDGPMHPSAIDRFDNPPLNQLSYWPTSPAGETATVDVFARERWNATGVYLEAGVTYKLKASGEWLDSSIPCGPDGMKDGTFHPGEVAHILSSAWGKAEEAYKAITGNAYADFWMTRRDEDIEWFALVGMVASGAWFDKKGRPASAPMTSDKVPGLTLNETFVIGEKATFTPKASGYLYCFANDVWMKYDNNRGSVRLTISRRA